MAKNEDHAFAYHCKKLETLQTINLAEIGSKSAGERTLRIIFIIATIILAAITITILLFKEKYFIPWISFIGGNLSGFGVSKLPNLITGKKEEKPKLNKTEEEKEIDE